MDYKALGDARDLWLPTSWRVQNTYFSSRIVCSRIIYTEKEYFYTRRHTHDFFEVQYITEGNSVFETEVDSYSVGAGDFILCAPEVTHRNVSVEQGTIKFGFAFYLDRVSSEFEKIRNQMIESKSVALNGGMRMAALITLIQQYLSDAGGLLYDAIVLHLMEIFLIGIFDCVSGGNCPDIPSQLALQVKTRSDSAEATVIQKVKRFISLNADHGMTVEEVAKAVGFCSRHLNRIVRQELNCGVKEIIMNARVEYIRRLLEDRHQTLERAAIQSGFTNAGAMNLFFKRATGETPTEYRARIGFLL